MTKQQTDGGFSLQQLSEESGVPPATLRQWRKQLGVFSAQGRFTANDLIAARAVRRLMSLPGATLESVRAILDVAGPHALDQLGRAPERRSAESPARGLQVSVRKAAEAGLFGDVMAEVGRAPAERQGAVVSLGEARVARLMAVRDERRKSG
jgi:hypothetical protein